MEKNSKNNVYWTLLNHSQWNMYIAATTEGLCYIGTPNAPFEELVTWVNKRLPSHTLTEEADILQPHAVELVDYLKEQRQRFLIANRSSWYSFSTICLEGIARNSIWTDCFIFGHCRTD